MNLSPLIEAPIAIQIHVASVVPAALIGPYMFWARKGTPRHRLLGRVWLGLMVVAALSSFFIHEIDVFHGFSPIHLISLYVLFGAWFAYRSARQRRIRDHRRQVLALYFGGIVGAGIFTLLPGRIMNKLVFGHADHGPEIGNLLLFLGVMAGVTLLLAAISGVAMARRSFATTAEERI
jgi:uncharacterized membrane protein